MSNPVKDALVALNRHAELVSQALKGPLDPRDGVSGKAIMELRQASALRPTGDEGYRLHPRLREYFFDHLQHYPAYQSLSQIGGLINQMRSLWTELEEMRNIADMNGMLEVRERLQDVVYDIGDNMQRNLQQLQTLLSTRYGNVRSLEAKKSQNRWYQQQSATLISDLGKLSITANKLEQEARSFGMPELAQFVRRQLIAHLMDWQQGLSEMQTLLRKEIFQTRQVQTNHRQLARLDMLLRQQPGWSGVEMEMDGDLPDFLLAARLPPVAPHVEPEDVDADVQRMIEDTAAALPAIRLQPPQPDPRHKRKKIDRQPPPMTPAMLAARRLTRDVLKSTEGVSLLQWRLADADAMTISPNVWLVFAALDLRQQDIKVTPLKMEPRAGEHWRHTFYDAVASGPLRKWASP